MDIEFLFKFMHFLIVLQKNLPRRISKKMTAAAPHRHGNLKKSTATAPHRDDSLKKTTANAMAVAAAAAPPWTSLFHTIRIVQPITF